MINRRNISNFAKFTSILLILFVVTYEIYDKRKTSNLKTKVLERVEPRTSVRSNDVLQDSIVNFSMEFLGTPYVAAGCGIDGFDCSGFVYYVFQHFDIDVPRSSAGFKNFGVEIPIEKVQKGDLLLFLSPTRNVIGHIGIVINSKGRKSNFIHASSGKEMKVIITNLSNEGYTRRFVKAVRVL